MNIYHTITIEPHKHPWFAATSMSGTGYFTNRISDVGGFSYIGVPCLFVNLCYGAFHSYGKAYASYQWLMALKTCVIVNEALAQGKRDMTEESVKNIFNGLFHQYHDEVKEAIRIGHNKALELAKETDSIHRVWTQQTENGLNFIITKDKEPVPYKVDIECTVSKESYYREEPKPYVYEHKERVDNTPELKERSLQIVVLWCQNTQGLLKVARDLKKEKARLPLRSSGSRRWESETKRLISITWAQAMKGEEIQDYIGPALVSASDFLDNISDGT